jgi:predicted house-cleaning noncanonical NTP pyrophosphatase (MazG superfamily)
MSFEHTETNLPLENEYPKLIRDRIPDLVHRKGVKTSTRKAASDEEYLEFLSKKIVEEAQELSEAESNSNITEEIADVYEIVDALIALKKLSKTNIAAVQQEKRDKRGGFEERLIMLEKPV